LSAGQKPPPGSVPMRPNCGNCMGCRVRRSQLMGARLLHESEFYEDVIFLTLTYSPECMPYDGGLHVRHFQLFVKKLRKLLPEGQKIKVSYCGEYGPSTLRPHFHALVFGYWPADAVPVVHRGDGVIDYDSEILRDCWGRGFVQFRPSDMGAAQYVARHNLKKVNGRGRDDVCPETGLKPYERLLESTGEVVEVRPEFFFQSRGVGERWLEKYYRDVFPDGVLPVAETLDLLPGVPRYYVEKLKSIDPAMHERYMVRVSEEAERLQDSGYWSEYQVNARKAVFRARKQLYGLYDKYVIE